MLSRLRWQLTLLYLLVAQLVVLLIDGGHLWLEATNFLKIHYRAHPV